MSLEDRIQRLPPKLRTEVEDFVNFLTDQDKRVSSGFLKMEWMGGLKTGRPENSVTLQKRLLK